jgi:hypothetical protein
MIKKVFCLLLFCVVALVATAQEVEFTADRPGASTGPATVGQKVIQLEQGIQYDGVGDGYGQFTFSNTLLRYGLFDGVELRLGGDALIHHTYDKWQPAFAGLAVGTKIRCFEGRGAIPAISVLADFAIPGTASRGFETEYFAPSLYLLFENPVNDWLSIGYNVGAEWDGATAHSTTFLALCLGFSITDRLGCFAESHNYFSQLGNGYCADFGFNYMVGERVQLDLAADLNLCDPKNCWAVSFGVAWQINNPKK